MFPARVNQSLLALRRQNQQIKLLYTIGWDLIFVNSSTYIQRERSRITRSKTSQALQEFQCSRDCFFFSFPRTVRQWNCLPDETVSCNTVTLFASSSQIFVFISTIVREKKKEDMIAASLVKFHHL